MNFKISAIVTFILLFSLSVFSQSKKDLKNNKVQSETSFVTINENGKEITYKDSYTTYDKEGRVVEETDYYKDGTIKQKKTNKYDSQKNKIEETSYDAKDPAKGESYTKTTFFYNKNNDKIGEIEYDAKGKIIKQSLIKYGNRGLKSERLTYSADKVLISTKKFTYTYR
jgi:YD repeat-containing protein